MSESMGTCTIKISCGKWHLSSTKTRETHSLLMLFKWPGSKFMLIPHKPVFRLTNTIIYSTDSVPEEKYQMHCGHLTQRKCTYIQHQFIFFCIKIILCSLITLTGCINNV